MSDIADIEVDVDAHQWLLLINDENKLKIKTKIFWVNF